MAIITSPCDTAAREPDVVFAAEQVRNSLERLEETVARLIGRLAPVLAPESPVGCEASPPPPGICPVSAEMYAVSGRMDGATCRLRALLDRLEI